MKTKEIYLLATASMLLVAGWAAWHFGTVPRDIDPPANTALSPPQATPVTQEATPAKSHRTGRPIISEVIETSEMKMARVRGAMSRTQASATALKDARNADPKVKINARQDRRKPDDIAFLKSLGLSDDLSGEVYQMLRAKADFFMDHQKEISEGLRRGEISNAYSRELSQMNADLEAAVGTENNQKIKYWQDTLLDRSQAADFKRYLQGRSFPLTEQQEATVVDAMHQAREGKVGFSLMMSSTSMEDKLAYIDTVKQSLAPVLNANEVALLGQHLKEVAEQPVRMKALDESIQKKLTDLQKKTEEMKRKASNPPAPPR